MQNTTEYSVIDYRVRGNARFAAYLGSSGAVVGYGPTRAIAIADLKQKLGGR